MNALSPPTHRSSVSPANSHIIWLPTPIVQESNFVVLEHVVGGPDQGLSRRAISGRTGRLGSVESRGGSGGGGVPRVARGAAGREGLRGHGRGAEEPTRRSFTPFPPPPFPHIYYSAVAFYHSESETYTQHWDKSSYLAVLLERLVAGRGDHRTVSACSRI